MLRRQRITRPFAFSLAAAVAVAGCGSSKKAPSASTKAPTTTAQSPATTTSATPPTTPKAATQARRRVDGQDIPTQFGDVQVSITLAGGRIVNVQWLKLPFDRPRSQFISQQASPILRSEVLTAQSARINIISGATYTSEAWAQSVQSALVSAGQH